MEGRDRLEGIPCEGARDRTQCRVPPRASLTRVKEAAARDKQTQFTALLHHVTPDALERAFRRLRRGAAVGIDGANVETYEQDLTQNIRKLHERLHTNRYRPRAVRRVYIPKSDGGVRPLGIPALEDKIVQSAVGEVLNAVYEVDFLGFSYGFRAGRSPHDALAALHTAVMSQYVNWVLDADIRSFFDSVDHEWMLRMLAHRVADPRILRLVRGWLRAGVLEEKEWKETTRGTPQGAGISPLLANIFLHYALDLWVHQWRRRHARGRVVIVRYADDFVMGFQYEDDARKMRLALEERLTKFALTLHPSKTRLIEFGRLPMLRRAQRGEKRPATFAFLGFTHYCAKTRDGRFVCKRRTQGTRMSSKLRQLRVEARTRMHEPVSEQHRWLCSVLRGHDAYYGLPSNHHALGSFHHEVHRLCGDEHAEARVRDHRERGGARVSAMGWRACRRAPCGRRPVAGSASQKTTARSYHLRAAKRIDRVDGRSAFPY